MPPGRSLFAFLREEHGEELWVASGRGEHGSRHGWVLSCNSGYFHNMKFMLPFLQESLVVSDPGILRDSVYARVSEKYVFTNMYVAAVRYNLVEQPMRALINSTEIGLTCADLSKLYDRVMVVMTNLLASAGVDWFYEEDFRVFSNADWPGLGEWDEHMRSRQLCCRPTGHLFSFFQNSLRETTRTHTHVYLQPPSISLSLIALSLFSLSRGVYSESEKRSNISVRRNVMRSDFPPRFGHHKFSRELQFFLS